MEYKTKPKSYVKLFFEHIFSDLKVLKQIYRDDKGKIRIETLEKLVESFFVNSMLLFLGPAVHSLYKYQSPHFIEGLIFCFGFGIILMFVQKGFTILFKKNEQEKLRFLTAFILIVLSGLFGWGLLIM